MKYLETKNYFINYLTLNLVSIFFYSGIYYHLLTTEEEHFHFPDAELIKDKSPKDNYLNALYFSVITQLSIGYGDITPKSNHTKIVSIFQAFCMLVITFICFSTLFQSYKITTVN